MKVLIAVCLIAMGIEGYSMYSVALQIRHNLDRANTAFTHY